MRVEADHQFDTYVPLAVFLDFRRDTTPSFKWSIPCSWAALAPPKGVIATCYDHKPLSHFSTWIMLLMPIKQRLLLLHGRKQLSLQLTRQFPFLTSLTRWCTHGRRCIPSLRVVAMQRKLSGPLLIVVSVMTPLGHL